MLNLEGRKLDERSFHPYLDSLVRLVNAVHDERISEYAGLLLLNVAAAAFKLTETIDQYRFDLPSGWSAPTKEDVELLLAALPQQFMGVSNVPALRALVLQNQLGQPAE
jgi:hypothetical protein